MTRVPHKDDSEAWGKPRPIPRDHLREVLLDRLAEAEKNGHLDLVERIEGALWSGQDLPRGKRRK
jgi:hypothetical protein